MNEAGEVRPDMYMRTMFGYTTLHEIPNPAFEKRKVFIYFNST